MAPAHARQYEARVGELEEKPVHADREQDKRDVRIGDDGERARAPIGLERDDGGMRGGQLPRTGRGLDTPAIEFAQQLRGIARHQVDHMLLEGLVCRQTYGLADGALGPGRVAPAHLSEAADIG